MVWKRLLQIVALSACIGLTGGIVIGMVLNRSKLLHDVAGDQQSWTDFRTATAKNALNKNGPAEHPVPKSEEPPFKVLLRDYFPQILIATVVMTLITVGFLLFTLAGVMRQSSRPPTAEAPLAASPPAETPPPTPPDETKKAEN